VVNLKNSTALNEFEIVTVKSGAKSLRSLIRNETFHPVTGPLVEANILHVQQQRLIERSAQAKEFVIWDVGLGAAANVLAAIEALRNSPSRIEIHSFDRTTSPLEFALIHAEELGYLMPYRKELTQLLSQKQVQVSVSIHWHLHLGDFGELLRNRAFPSPHAILYDPYSPVGNPDMWTLEHFCLLRSCLNSQVPCLLTNYTRSTAVRVALFLAGFFVGKGSEVGEKAETTIAANQLQLLQNPLDRQWLERVRNSTNAAPLRSSSDYSKSRISAEDLKRLELSPQFRS
jgi:tRNA U34 5-methylaminomethyl-2-thiouridine-forming methyltransferase MnmC